MQCRAERLPGVAEAGVTALPPPARLLPVSAQYPPNRALLPCHPASHPVSYLVQRGHCCPVTQLAIQLVTGSKDSQTVSYLVLAHLLLQRGQLQQQVRHLPLQLLHPPACVPLLLLQLVDAGLHPAAVTGQLGGGGGGV